MPYILPALSVTPTKRKKIPVREWVAASSRKLAKLQQASKRAPEGGDAVLQLVVGLDLG